MTLDRHPLLFLKKTTTSTHHISEPKSIGSGILFQEQQLMSIHGHVLCKSHCVCVNNMNK